MQLAELIGAAEWKDFRQAFLDRRSIVHAESASPNRFRSLWSDWELDAACRFTPLPQQEFFRLLLRGKTIQPAAFTDRLGEFREEAFRQLRRSGASVAFASFEDFSNPALALTRALEAEFKLPVQVNVYATPGENQGLGAHVDPHDVLVLQIQGEKVWDIYDGADAGSSVPAATTLKEGGWLYLPKGTRHEVRNRGERESVHFTLGFHPLTWGEVFQRALNRARIAAPELNEPLPHGASVEDSPDRLRQRLQAVLAFVDSKEVSSSYYAGFPALGVQVPASAMAERTALENAGESSPFRWRDEARLALSGDKNPRVLLDYRRFPLELRQPWSVALAWMQETKTFQVTAMPVADKAVALQLARFLTNLGVLSLAAQA